MNKPSLLLPIFVPPIMKAVSSIQVIYELPTTNQWCFDVEWCPRNPALLSTASFDGRITVYSVMGGSLKAQQQSTAERVMFALSLKDFEFNCVCIYGFICLNRV